MEFRAWISRCARDYFIPLRRESALRLWKDGAYPELEDDEHEPAELVA